MVSESDLHLLKAIPLFQSLSEKQLDSLARSLVPRQFYEGEYIIHQGEAGDSFFIVEDGEVLVQLTLADGEVRNLTTCVHGDFFGEKSLMTDEPRAADCIAVGVVKCLVLDRESFNKALSGAQALLGSQLEYYQHGASDLSVIELSNHVREYRQILDRLRRYEDAYGTNFLDGERGVSSSAPSDETMAYERDMVEHELTEDHVVELNFDDQLRRVVQTLKKDMGAEHVRFFIVEDPKKGIQMRMLDDAMGTIDNMKICGLPAEVMRCGDVVWVPSTTEAYAARKTAEAQGSQPLWTPYYDEKTGLQSRTAVGIPVMVSPRLLAQSQDAASQKPADSSPRTRSAASKTTGERENGHGPETDDATAPQTQRISMELRTPVNGHAIGQDATSPAGDSANDAAAAAAAARGGQHLSEEQANQQGVHQGMGSVPSTDEDNDDESEQSDEGDAEDEVVGAVIEVINPTKLSPEKNHVLEVFAEHVSDLLSLNQQQLSLTSVGSEYIALPACHSIFGFDVVEVRGITRSMFPGPKNTTNMTGRSVRLVFRMLHGLEDLCAEANSSVQTLFCMDGTDFDDNNEEMYQDDLAREGLSSPQKKKKNRKNRRKASTTRGTSANQGRQSRGGTHQTAKKKGPKATTAVTKKQKKKKKSSSFAAPPPAVRLNRGISMAGVALRTRGGSMDSTESSEGDMSPLAEGDEEADEPFLAGIGEGGEDEDDVDAKEENGQHGVGAIVEEASDEDEADEEIDSESDSDEEDSDDDDGDDDADDGPNGSQPARRSGRTHSAAARFRRFMATYNAYYYGERITFGIRVRDLPRACRILIAVEYDHGHGAPVPLCHAIVPLFSSHGVLRSGRISIPMKPGRPDPEPRQPKVLSVESGVRVVINFDAFNQKQAVYTDVERKRFLPLSRMNRLSTVFHAAPSVSQEEVEAVLHNDALHVLADYEKRVLWQSRLSLVYNPAALPKFLQAVKWDERSRVLECYRLLQMWAPMEALSALELLDVQYPDPKVRAYAVRCLSALSDRDLSEILLQLVQVLKFEPSHDTALCLFLVRRALRSPALVGHVLFWTLRSESHVTDEQFHCRVMLEQYVKNLGRDRLALGHQMFIIRKLEEVCQKVQEACRAISQEGAVEVAAADGEDDGDMAEASIAADADEGSEEGPAQLGLVRQASTKRRLNSANEVLQAELSKLVFPSKFQLPLDPSFECCGIYVDRCRVMSSAKKPLFVTFKQTDPAGTPLMVLFKEGDDLRQDQLTLQVLRIMDKLWKQHGLELSMCPYIVTSTGNMQGMLQIVPHAETLAGIVEDEVVDQSKGKLSRKITAAREALSGSDSLLRWLYEHNSDEDAVAATTLGAQRSPGGDDRTQHIVRQVSGADSPSRFRRFRGRSRSQSTSTDSAGSGSARGPAASSPEPWKLKAHEVLNPLMQPTKFHQALDRFAASCAGYCVATYVLGIGDRHNDNIMCTKDGRLFHIDFGHFLGNYKYKLGVKRERAPFVFTAHMAAVLGGERSGARYRKFEELCCRAYNILRQHGTLLLTLFSLMVSCGIPELTSHADLLWLRDALMVGTSDEDATAHFEELIDTSLNSRSTAFNHAIHLLKHTK